MKKKIKNKRQSSKQWYQKIATRISKRVLKEHMKAYILKEP